MCIFCYSIAETHYAPLGSRPLIQNNRCIFQQRRVVGKNTPNVGKDPIAVIDCRIW